MAEIKKYKDIKGRKWSEGGIPKWIFRTGGLEYEDLPEDIKTMYRHILNNNPGYELFYFSDKDCLQFLMDEYTETHLRQYNTFIPTAYKADYFRYCLLNTYGGCYGDFTMLPLITYDEMVKGVDRVLVRDDGTGLKSSLWNALMCVQAEDPILAKSIEIAGHNADTKYIGNTPFDVAGPTVLGEAFRQVGYNDVDGLDISLGDYKGSRIYIHNKDVHVKDVNGKSIVIKKFLSIHNATLYSQTNKHYYDAWFDGEVYK
jgi:mannosyltransferase OCH1-like enzyme